MRKERHGRRHGQRGANAPDELPVTFNGESCKGVAEQTILDLAEARGVRIPTLCHDPHITPATSCGVCTVEVRRGDRWDLVPACGTPIFRNIEIRTESEAIERSRRWALELLMSDHYADCVAPCTLACPAQVDVPGYVRAVEEGRYADAMARIRRTNPFPGVCGRVCPHSCEKVCRRALLDSPVAINHIKRLATDSTKEPQRAPKPGPSSGKRVAVVGAGPAGLTASWFLRLQGHAVELFDAREKPGGMLRYAIPEYRLSRTILDGDLELLMGLGVQFKPNQRLGRDLSVDALFEQGFDAVFVALGAWKGRNLRVPGEDADGVMGSLAFLNEVNEHERLTHEGPVVVVGGGNSAIDAARAAVRMGAKPVRILYRRTRDQMPAHHEEIEAALEEGVELHNLVSPLAVELEDGQVKAVQLQRMKLGEADRSGRPRPVPIEDSEHSLSASLVITAVGESPELPPTDSDDDRPINVVDSDTLCTVRAGLFAGGDFVTGPSTVVEAIGAGRRAATSIDRYLREGRAEHPAAERYSRCDDLAQVTSEDCPPAVSTARAPLPAREPKERVADFEEGELGYDSDTGKNEAERCLRCGCDAFDSCELRRLIEEYQVEQGRLIGEVHRYQPVWLRRTDDGLGLHLDMNKCVRCERCVRTCDERAGAGALEFVLRGFDTRLFFALAPDTVELQRCDKCLADGALCVGTCPTGALTTDPSEVRDL